MSRRNGFDIIVDILSIAESGARKTSVVYGANLNFPMATKYISKLIENNMLEKSGSYYFATHKGKRFMNRYKELREELVW